MSAAPRHDPKRFRVQLHFAACDGRTSAVKAALETPGTDVNQQDFLGRTALFLACNYRHRDIVQLLVEAGADPNTCINDGKPLLLFTALKLDLELMSFLLFFGARVDVNTNGASVPLITMVEHFFEGTKRGGEVLEMLRLALAMGDRAPLLRRGGREFGITVSPRDIALAFTASAEDGFHTRLRLLQRAVLACRVGVLRAIVAADRHPELLEAGRASDDHRLAALCDAFSHRTLRRVHNDRPKLLSLYIQLIVRFL